MSARVEHRAQVGDQALDSRRRGRARRSSARARGRRRRARGGRSARARASPSRRSGGWRVRPWSSTSAGPAPACSPASDHMVVGGDAQRALVDLRVASGGHGGVRAQQLRRALGALPEEQMADVVEDLAAARRVSARRSGGRSARAAARRRCRGSRAWASSGRAGARCVSCATHACICAMITGTATARCGDDRQEARVQRRRRAAIAGETFDLPGGAQRAFAVAGHHRLGEPLPYARARRASCPRRRSRCSRA